MKCLSCEQLSFSIICKKCQANLLQPSFYKRELEPNFFNYSFYGFSEIEEFLTSKYYFHGDRVYNILAKLSFKKFASNFSFDEVVYSIGIDEHTRHDFSQTAILSHHLKSKFIKPLYGRLKATNIIKYAGKDLEFRQKNKRKFKTTLENKKIILVDDLVTTGTTILEAKKVLEKKGNKVLFSLTLADAKI
ncbi:phosphoribosyltransferase [Halarcobacter ebronensis]|uniref:Phosphoribosyltransferase n=1 Tax=Halarcobacter ebronensis TaxID=1462615 RepID=A0A4Q0YAQ2_9BACT|nr:phosphoribosyltransferase family protein [Halarcobacter ebronensis]RXJ66985.1 phosphoribosyltransferase [Halarcobacter ebronensis]